MILKINDRIRNRQIEYFDQFRLALRYDAVCSRFSFLGQFDPDNAEHKDIYCVGHYHIVTLEHNGNLLLTGYMVSESLKSSKVKSPVSVGGYSLTGALEDCNLPKSIYPIQFDKMTLREIVEKVITPFGIKYKIDVAVEADMNVPINETEAEPTQTVRSFLTELMMQKGIVMTHDELGRIIFTKANTKKKPILNYGGTGLPCPEMTLTFNGQAMHSDITVIRQASKEGGNASEFTIKNPYVPYVLRTKTVIQKSGDDISVEAAARAILSEELSNISVSFSTDRWEIDGRVIKPGDLITILNPEIYLYKRSTWLIEQVELVGNSKALVAEIKCVLPEVYNTDAPEYLFKGINLH